VTRSCRTTTDGTIRWSRVGSGPRDGQNGPTLRHAWQARDVHAVEPSRGGERPATAPPASRPRCSGGSRSHGSRHLEPVRHFGGPGGRGKIAAVGPSARPAATRNRAQVVRHRVQDASAQPASRFLVDKRSQGKVVGQQPPGRARPPPAVRLRLPRRSDQPPSTRAVGCTDRPHREDVWGTWGA
jgi:hypothetical protein